VSIVYAHKEMSIYAPAAEAKIINQDFKGYRIHITGDPKQPVFVGVRFLDCEIVADNFRAFDCCYFDDDCLMRIESMPVIQSQCVSINDNRVPTMVNNTNTTEGK